MDNNNRTPPTKTGDRGADLPPASRQRIIKKILETLKRHFPVSDQDGLAELEKAVTRFEEKVYNAAVDQCDYLRRIALKMLPLEYRSQNKFHNPLPPNPSGNSNGPQDHGAFHTAQLQVHNQGQALPIPVFEIKNQVWTFIQESIPYYLIIQESTRLPGWNTFLYEPQQVIPDASSSITVPEVTFSTNSYGIPISSDLSTICSSSNSNTVIDEVDEDQELVGASISEEKAN